MKILENGDHKVGFILNVRYVPEDVGFAREIKIRVIKVAYCMFFLKIKIRYEMQRNIEISPPTL